ncbi:MAG: 6-phosphofructokinase, partial [Thaumarchaeota archaeon]
MRIGVLTGGGDCPGLNAVIQAVVTRASQYGFEVLGIEDGYKGLLEGRARPLRKEDVRDIYAIGGTILGTSRKNPTKSEEDIRRVLENVEKLGLDGLITIGGDDTLGAARKLYERGVPIVGVPKTIDNDLSATDYS